MDPNLLAVLLAAIEADNLVIVCGAGLSRTEPSKVPAASELATSCARVFTQATGLPVPDGADTNLELLATFLFGNPDYWRLFLKRLINWGPFMRGPNPGHQAISDLLCCGAVRFAVTTNFDTLIEFAAESMGEPVFRAALDGDQMQERYSHRSLLKLHGCVRKDEERTLWCRRQYDEIGGDAVIRDRLESASNWLNINLKGCHILIVGYWSDWPHFNDALSAALATQPLASITLVDIGSDEYLREKTPQLWDVAGQLGDRFKRARISGAEFLAELRKGQSLRFFERVLCESVPVYRDLGGGKENPLPLVPADLGTDELYDLRRDICGVAPNEVVRDHAPNKNMQGVGAVHLLVQEKGFQFSGNRYETPDGTRIRVINAASDSLHRVKDRFSVGRSATNAKEVVICAATTGDGGVPEDIVRDRTNVGGIVRAETNSQWLDVERARERGFC